MPGTDEALASGRPPCKKIGCKKIGVAGFNLATAFAVFAVFADFAAFGRPLAHVADAFAPAAAGAAVALVDEAAWAERVRTVDGGLGGGDDLGHPKI